MERRIRREQNGSAAPAEFVGTLKGFRVVAIPRKWPLQRGTIAPGLLFVRLVCWRSSNSSIPLPSPPAEKTAASQHQTGQSSTGDGAGDGSRIIRMVMVVMLVAGDGRGDIPSREKILYCKRPFGGPKEVLHYLARYTHRVAISNRRLIACDEKGVTFKWKDYRIEGPDRYKVMTLATHEFIRRFLIHVLPAGFHRIRYYGLLASGRRAENVARARELLMPPVIPVDAIKASSANAAEPQTASHSCPCCGGCMIIIERFERGATPHHRPSPPISAIRIDTS
jgi:hypothetical protein